MAKDFTADIVWKAIYNDGTFLWERDQNGIEHKFDEIDQTKLKEFHLMKPSDKLEDYVKEESEFMTVTTNDEKVEVRIRTFNREILPIYKVILDGQKRLIWFRRGSLIRGQHVIDMGKFGKIPIPVGINNKIMVVGWQETINGKNVQALNYIHPDGRIELAGAWGSDVQHSEPQKAIDPKESVNT